MFIIRLGSFSIEKLHFDKGRLCVQSVQKKMFFYLYMRLFSLNNKFQSLNMGKGFLVPCNQNPKYQFNQGVIQHWGILEDTDANQGYYDRQEIILHKEIPMGEVVSTLLLEFQNLALMGGGVIQQGDVLHNTDDNKDC